VSHSPQRKEKDCLNCGTVVQGHYCHHCGQENIVPKETFWHMLTHFFNDITHFDGSFFTTAKDLLFKPGFLSSEYMKGRRVSYLHPVRMYVFTSAIFFLLFFTFFSGDESLTITNNNVKINGKQRLQLLTKLENKIKNDSSRQKDYQRLQVLKDTTLPLEFSDFQLFNDGAIINLTGKSKQYKLVEEYDSVQHSLPASKRDGWFKNRLVKKEIYINKKYGADPQSAFKKLRETVLHRLPYMLFISLPLFALILRLVYLRRKQFYFADHGVFTIHFYVFSFLLLLVVFSLNKLDNVTHLGFIGFLEAALILLLFFYLYKAMRNFYGQRRGKTLLKLLLVMLFSLIMMLILFILFLFFSAVTL